MKIAFIGAGKMAEGVISAMKDVSGVAILEKNADRRREIASKYGVEAAETAKDAVRGARLVFLCVRPQDVKSAAEELASASLKGKTVVSIVAGKTLAGLRECLGPGPALVRVMPNLALRANAGMCAVCPGEGVKSADLKAVLKILSGAGETVVLEEKHFDAVTALSGSGPAYFAYMQQAMAEAGAALGLPEDVAALLSAQTMYGTAKFLRESKMPLGPFIAGVATKGGTTAAGMEILSKPRFKEIVAKTLAAAAARSRALA